MKSRALIFLVSALILTASTLAAVAVISGEVISSAANAPLVRAAIWWNGEFHSYSDIDGKFEILGTDAGDIIRVHKTDYVDTSAIANSANEVFEFQVAPVWELESANQVYEDVPTYAWYEPAIRKLYETQTLTASTRQKFFPSENLTRGELAVLGVKVAGFLPPSITTTNFCDVSPDDDFAAAVEFMFAHGWLSGYPSTSCTKGKVFRPSLPVNRAEAVKMALIAFQDLVDKKVEASVCLPSGFTDVPRDAWFAGFVDSANCLGFVNGYPDGTFRPANPVNRAEIAVILANALESLF
ncbi:MAG: S-layer homology domain-containing protein [Candidatus Peribacteraceae bacterium]|nr:S-layer homology domain-containing protein [Candidatus Peribacteraceae bacterium]